jgi:hypothetical protein
MPSNEIVRSETVPTANLTGAAGTTGTLPGRFYNFNYLFYRICKL